MTEKNLKIEINKSPFSGIAVPVAIVLIGALIIFGVSKMLTTDKNHRDLINEMHSKTFGNRWIAAYELSKYLATSRIPEQDVSWVVENLSSIYGQSQDARTRNFIILALANIDHPTAFQTVMSAVDDVDQQVQFNAIVAIGKSDKIPSDFNWDRLVSMMEGPDIGLRQILIYTLAKHKVEIAKLKIQENLTSSEQTLRYAAGIGLLNYKDENALPIIKELFALDYEGRGEGVLNGAQVEALKISAIEIVSKADWSNMMRVVADLAKNDTNHKVAIRGQELELKLKN